jgi:hypothetical protein
MKRKINKNEKALRKKIAFIQALLSEKWTFCWHFAHFNLSLSLQSTETDVVMHGMS